jgi:hypothetical protein
MPVLPRPISSSPDQFREFADEAADWARTARSDKERAIFLQMARTWLEAAVALERKLGIIGNLKADNDHVNPPARGI